MHSAPAAMEFSGDSGPSVDLDPCGKCGQPQATNVPLTKVGRRVWARGLELKTTRPGSRILTQFSDLLSIKPPKGSPRSAPGASCAMGQMVEDSIRLRRRGGQSPVGSAGGYLAGIRIRIRSRRR